MIQPKPVSSGDFKYQKVFGEDQFHASGMVYIPVRSLKPAKQSKDNSYVSLVIPDATLFLLNLILLDVLCHQKRGTSNDTSDELCHWSRGFVHDTSRWASVLAALLYADGRQRVQD